MRRKNPHLWQYKECIRKWASGEVNHARTRSGAMFFEDAVLYSYGHHYPMARIVIGLDGSQAALMNDDSNSATTNKHMALVRLVVSDNFEHSFHVPTHSLKRWPDADLAHRDAIEHYTRKARDAWERSKNKRIRQRDVDAERALNYINHANEYAKFFGLREPFRFEDLPEDARFAFALGVTQAALRHLVKENT